MFDPDLYRDPDEVERWKQRDPITTSTNRLVGDGTITDDDVAGMWTAARDETERAVIAADEAPIESVDTLLDHVLRPVEPTVIPGDAVPGDPVSGGRDEVEEVWP
jgi:pyruvate dehydrogenase E1 component alpha subunit